MLLLFCEKKEKSLPSGSFKMKRKSGKNGKNTIQGSMYILLIGVFIFFGIAFVFSSVLINKKTKLDNEIKESETLLNAAKESLSASLDNYKDISRLLMLRSEVTAFLRADKVDAGLINDTKAGIWDVLNVCNCVDSVFVFRNDNLYAYTGKTLYSIDFNLLVDDDWLMEVNSKRGGAVIFMNGNGAVYKKSFDSIITIARSIFDIYTQNQCGILLVNISTNMLDRIALSQEGASLAFFTDEGVFLAGDEDLKECFDTSFDSETIVHIESGHGKSKCMYSGIRVSDTPIVIVCKNTAFTGSLPREIVTALLFLLLAFILSVLLAGFFVAKYITRPIENLSKEMDKTRESSGFENIYLNLPQNEIGRLKDSYNKVVDYANNLFNENLEKEKDNRKLELRVLQEQIKPHFLYNSMETISYMALDAGAKKVHEALETLGSFYRNFLSKGDREIPFKREVSIVKDYISLQRLRYGDILKGEFEISEDTYEVKVPKLLLQPLVENSIYHGIRPKGEAGVIRVKAEIKDNFLYIFVYDSGIGMSGEDIKRVLDGEKGLKEKEVLSGFGLRGTIDRIRIFTGKKDSVEIKSELGEYTEILIKIQVS